MVMWVFFAAVVIGSLALFLVTRSVMAAELRKESDPETTVKSVKSGWEIEEATSEAIQTLERRAGIG